MTPGCVIVLTSHKDTGPLLEENLSLCSVQSEEGVAPQGVHRAEAAAALWPSAVLLLSQHRRGILNPGFSPRTSRAGTKTEEEEEEEENKLRVAAERKTLCDQNASNTSRSMGPSKGEGTISF